jgi:thiol-disulfide isomerase/thioredoxin
MKYKETHRITLFFLFMIVIFSYSYGQSNSKGQAFVLNGKITGQNDGFIYLVRYDYVNRKVIKDTALITNGMFHFKGTVTEPVEYFITLSKDASNDLSGNTTSVFIEPAVMTITLKKGDFKNATVSGSESQRDMDVLKSLKAGINKQLAPLSKGYQKANNEYIAAMRRTKNEDSLQFYKDKAVAAKDAMDPFIEQLNKIDAEFIQTHPASYVTASLMRYKTSSMTVSEIESIYNKMPVEIQKSSYGSYIQKDLDDLKAGSPGAKAHDFTATDINGNQLTLAGFKGKYVMLDFWASWCVPCRKGNPHLKDLYHKYKSKGFEIIGISDDDNKPEAWKKAVEKDGIGIWKHVLRGLKRTQNGYDDSGDISHNYGIHTLPTKILIDPKGMIVGRYGGGGEDDNAMDKKLEEIFEGK